MLFLSHAKNAGPALASDWLSPGTYSAAPNFILAFHAQFHILPDT